ncbi:MAG: tetratricopeptide repeat protein, partial [Methylocella sp.]
TSNIIQITKGPNSPAIVGNHNFVVGPGFAADKPRWGMSPPAAETRQTTIGPSSPAIGGDHDNNNDIDARALKRLNDQLDEKNLAIAEKIAEADEWARKYRELDQQLTEARSQAAAKGDDATLIKAVQDLLHKGKLEEAGNIYDQLLACDESNVDRAAQDHFGRAQIYALQFRPLDALPHYAMAYQYRPDHVEYALGYAWILGHQKQFSKAEAVFEGLLPQMRDLAAQNPAAYRPDLATTLSSLATVYDETNRFDDAKNAFKEAIAIRRDLTAQNPAAYRPDRATTLGNLVTDTHQFGDAESAFNLTESESRGPPPLRINYAVRFGHQQEGCWDESPIGGQQQVAICGLCRRTCECDRACGPGRPTARLLPGLDNAVRA